MKLTCMFSFTLLFGATGLILFIHLQDLSEIVQQQIPGVQQAPAATSLATMGVQQAPIVLPSPPTITFQFTSPHCRRPAGPCSDLFGHYGRPAGPQSIQQAPAVTSLATMGVQQAPIVLPSPPTITFQVTSPHCRHPAGPCSDLAGHYGRIQQAPAVTSLATMGVQQAPIVLPSPPTITFQVTSPHCRHPAGPCSDLAGHYGRIQQAPAVTSLATMGVQQAPIVLPSPPTITFQVTSPHCRHPAGPCSDLAGHYGRIQQAPAVTSLATMGVQQAPIVLPSPPTITFQVTSPHCRHPAGPCSDLAGHYGRIQQAPAVTSLATMGVQQAPIVLPSPPTITFQVTSPHCRHPAGPCSDLAGHYGRPAGPHSAPFSVKWFSTSCELQQGRTAPFYSLPQQFSKCNLLGYPPFTAGIQQAPAVTSLATMGVQQDPIVVSSL
ncbi:UNVERIFIED_CONTAM: hypothetical protein FKN15_003445 [Acipenser sinensis]